MLKLLYLFVMTLLLRPSPSSAFERPPRLKNTELKLSVLILLGPLRFLKSVIYFFLLLTYSGIVSAKNGSILSGEFKRYSLCPI